MITEILNSKKEAILSKWIDLIFNSFPVEAGNFLKLKKNQFSNPIGYTITTNAKKLLLSEINVHHVLHTNI